MLLPGAIYSRMSREEHKHLKHLREAYVDMVDVVARKMVHDQPRSIDLQELVDKRDAFQIMLGAFEQDMIEKYTLNPLVTESPFTPPPVKK